MRRFTAVSMAPMALFPLRMSCVARMTVKFVVGSNVVSPGLLARFVTASIIATVSPVGNRPMSFPAPRIVVGCSGTVSP